MRKRMMITLAALVAFVAGIGMVKFFQIKAAIARGASWQPPPEAVTTVVGGGCQEAPCAIAALIWKNFTMPMPATKATSAASVMIIRFLMRRLLYRVVPVTSIP